MTFEEAIAFLREDAVLGPYVERLPEPDFERTENPLRSLVRAIVYQQLSGKAAGTIYGRMATRIGADEQMEPGHLLAVSAEDLRGAGLSQSKAAYLHNIARHFEEHQLTLEHMDALPDEVLRAELVGIKGVGQWTVDMFMMFALVRPDIWPAGDLGVQKGAQIAHGLTSLPKPKEMPALAESWRPYRSAAAWYMWRIVEEPGT